MVYLNCTREVDIHTTLYTNYFILIPCTFLITSSHTHNILNGYTSLMVENPMQPSFLGHPTPPPLWNTMSNLFAYSLRGNKVGDTGAQALAEGLQHCTNLQNLEWVICLCEHQVYVKPVWILGFIERVLISSTIRPHKVDLQIIILTFQMVIFHY